VSIPGRCFTTAGIDVVHPPEIPAAGNRNKARGGTALHARADGKEGIRRAVAGEGKHSRPVRALQCDCYHPAVAVEVGWVDRLVFAENDGVPAPALRVVRYPVQRFRQVQRPLESVTRVKSRLWLFLRLLPCAV